MRKIPECCDTCKKCDGKYCLAEHQILWPPGRHCPHYEAKNKEEKVDG